MKCVHCGGEMRLQPVTIDEQMGGTQVTIRNVPAWVCADCGEEEIAGPVLIALEALAEALASNEQLGACKEPITISR